MRVADAVADGLARAGVAHVFAGPDTAEVSALTAACAARGLAVVSAPSSSAACLMGEVTGLLAEAPGAVVLTSLDAATGPALAQAGRDQAPLLVIAAHAAGTAGATAGIVKEAITVTPDSAGRWIAHTAQLASRPPRGPVALVVDPAIASATAVPAATRPRPESTPAPDAAALDAAAAAVCAAARPALLAGRGCARPATASWLRALAESLPAPTLVTLAAKGALPDPHPLHLGVLGAGAAGEAVLARADLVVALGFDTGEPGAAAPPVAAPVLLVAEEPAPPSGWSVRQAVRGDVDVVLAELAPRLRGQARADWDLTELDRLKRAVSAAPAGPGACLASLAILTAVRDGVPAGTTVVVDVGALTPAVAAAWPATAPLEMVVPRGTSPAGFPLAAAAAARLARPGAPVVVFCAAGGLTSEDMRMAATVGGPLVVVILAGEGETPLAAGWSRVRVTRHAGLGAACAGTVASERPWIIDARSLAGIG